MLNVVTYHSSCRAMYKFTKICVNDYDCDWFATDALASQVGSVPNTKWKHEGLNVVVYISERLSDRNTVGHMRG